MRSGRGYLAPHTPGAGQSSPLRVPYDPRTATRRAVPATRRRDPQCDDRVGHRCSGHRRSAGRCRDLEPGCRTALRVRRAPGYARPRWRSHHTMQTTPRNCSTCGSWSTASKGGPCAGSRRQLLRDRQQQRDPHPRRRALLHLRPRRGPPAAARQAAPARRRGLARDRRRGRVPRSERADDHADRAHPGCPDRTDDVT